MANGNHDALPSPPDLPDPIRKAMLAHAHVQAEAAWWVFSVATYAAYPSDDALVALGDQARDFMATIKLIEGTTVDFVRWVDEVRRERSDG